MKLVDAETLAAALRMVDPEKDYSGDRPFFDEWAAALLRYIPPDPRLDAPRCDYGCDACREHEALADAEQEATDAD